jgi:hypothetical protein
VGEDSKTNLLDPGPASRAHPLDRAQVDVLESVTMIKSHMADVCREAITASEDEWARMRTPEETRSLVDAMADRQLALSEHH